MTHSCTCINRPGDEYYCPVHGGEGSWIDLKVKADMLIEKLGDWIVIQDDDVKQTAAKEFGAELKALGQTLQALQRDEWVTVECTGGNCRGRRRLGKGFDINIKSADLKKYKDGVYRPVCNECFCK